MEGNIDKDTRWHNCPYQRYFHKKNLERARAMQKPDCSLSVEVCDKIAVNNSPQSGPLTFQMYDTTTLTQSPTTAISSSIKDEMDITKRIENAQLKVCIPMTPVSCSTEDNHWISLVNGELSPTSAAILNGPVEFEDPNDIHVEYDEKRRPRLNLLTTFKGGF